MEQSQEDTIRVMGIEDTLRALREEVAEMHKNHNANILKEDDSCDIRVCWGRHERSEGCNWERYVPATRLEAILNRVDEVWDKIKPYLERLATAECYCSVEERANSCGCCDNCAQEAIDLFLDFRTGLSGNRKATSEKKEETDDSERV